MRKRFTLALLSLLVVPLAMMAQNVTISPSTGSLIAALTTGSESGFENGFSAMWRHEQLPLTFTVSDFCNLTDGGEFVQPAGNMIDHNGYLVVDGGSSPDSYMCLSLPKGYRFTGYTIVLANNLVNQTISGTNHASSSEKVFYETNDLSYHASTTSMNYNNVSDQNQYTSIVNDISNKNSHYLAVAKKNDDTYLMPASNETDYYTITRESMNESDMGNHLYFRISHSNSTGIYGLTIVSFEVYFTAEGTFDADVKPAVVGPATSVVASPFTTSKLDIGDMQVQEKNNKKFFAYTYENVRDLVGYTYLYQDDALFNDAPADVAAEKKISPVKVGGENAYALKNGDYYIETPVTVHTQTGLESPVGFRIIGATFNYKWGSQTTGGTQTKASTCSISFNYYGRTYYLTDQLSLSTSEFLWDIDDIGNICSGENYLACSGSGDERTITIASEKENLYNMRQDNGNVFYRSNGGNYYYFVYQISGNTAYIRVIKNPGYQWTRWTCTVRSEATITLADYNPGTYTLTIYDKTGKANATNPITVSGSSSTGSYHLTGLNNDAVKFSISGLEEGKQALVSVTLEMQALDPYIDKMDIVCHDTDNQLSLTQSFTADDFSVSGGKFVFYIPQEYQNSQLTFTFSDLYSKYGDNTYYTGTDLQKNGYGRYSFVTSSYFEPINGNGNDGLYASTYNPNATYTNKVFTSKAGNIRFKFNNAEDLGNTGQGTGYLEETPFSVAAYLGSANPDATSGQPVGAFIDCKLKASDETQKSGIYYVFTADETRYNIAPTKAWQHRSYAFYRMDIELQAKTYSPVSDWTEIYKNTSYADVNAQNKDIDQDKSMWGLKLGTKDSQTGAAVTGYLTVKEIDDAITAALTATGGPTTADQILYIDASDLYSVVNSHELSLAQLKAKLSPNALIYLPENTTSTLDNFAYMTGSGTFRAGKDIVLTDKKPFYAPYDIQVDAANYAKYDRKITWASAGKNTLQTVLLPFTIDVTGGKHTEEDNTAFTLNKMVADNCLSIDHAEDANAENFKSKAYFEPIEGNISEANIPYMVQVTTAPSDSQTPFKVSQKGALVKASVLPDAHKTDYLWEGETASGSINSTSYSFQNYGSYSGKSLPAADGYFYFARGMYLNSKNIRPEVSEVLVVYPFRAYFKYNEPSGAKRMGFMDVVFGENETSGIDALERRVSIDENAPVYDMQGRMIAPAMRDLAGKKLPRGIYVVNGVKIIVK